MSVALPVGQVELDRHAAAGDRIGIRGARVPLAFEKRIVASTGSPCRCAARESFDASGVGVKVPLQTVPLAWTAR